MEVEGTVSSHGGDSGADGLEGKTELVLAEERAQGCFVRHFQGWPFLVVAVVRED